MNSFASLIPQRNGGNPKKNHLMGWLNKPTFHQLGANLAPLQNFVKRKAGKNPFAAFGIHHQSIPDDQTVDTTTTWEDKLRIQNQPRHSHHRIKQTVVFVSHDPPPAATVVPPSQQRIDAEQLAREKRQRKSQQKNKVLMLLQMEQVTGQRIALRQQRQTVLKDYLFKVLRSRIKHRRVIQLHKIAEVDRRIRLNRQRTSQPLFLSALSEFYRKFDTCLEELKDRNEIMELEGFKQLVIREVEERAEALQSLRERLTIVHGQLMQKFIVDELIEGGLYSSVPRRSKDTMNEWIHVEDDDSDGEDVSVRSTAIPDAADEWIVCDCI